MIVEIAIATNTAPRHWWDEDDRTLATALVILDEIADAAKHHRR